MGENRTIKFITTTLTARQLFLVTAVFMLYIPGEAVDYMLVIAEPMADRVPLDTSGGVALASLIAIAILILFCCRACRSQCNRQRFGQKNSR